MFKKRFLALLVLALVTALSGCSPASKAPIKIGFVSPLTGDTSSYGQMAKRSIDLVLEEIGSKIDGRQVVVNYFDDAGDPKQAVAGAQKFADDKDVVAIISSALSSNSLAMIPVIDRAHLTTVAYSSSAPTLSGASPYFFRVCGTDAQYGVIMADWAKEKGYKAAAVVYQNTDYGKLLKDAFNEEAGKIGIQVLGSWAYLTTDRDFQAILTEIKGKKPDVLVLSSNYTDGGLVLQQARSVGVTCPAVGPGGLNTPKFLEFAGKGAEGCTVFTIYASDSKDPTMQAFQKKFANKYQMAPDQPAAIAYDAIRVLFDAISRAGKSGQLTREAVHKAMTQTSFQGANGKVTFNSKGDWIRPYPYLVVKDGKLVSPSR